MYCQRCASYNTVLLYVDGYLVHSNIGGNLARVTLLLQEEWCNDIVTHDVIWLKP